MPVFRIVAGLLAPFALAGCLPSLQYSETPWERFVEHPRCNPASTPASAPASTNAKRFYLVTSRLPDCRQDPIALTVQRTDRIRYGRFDRPEMVMQENGKRLPENRVEFSEPSAWWKSLGAHARQHDGRVMVYVHGYNEVFTVTAEDTADMAAFTGFEGPVVHYSWPSRGAVLGYAIDENNAEFDEQNFSAVIDYLVRMPEIRDIVLVSHSMGARLAIPAIEHADATNPPDVAAKLRTIVLAAPDYDRQLFGRKARDTLLTADRAKRGRSITVYASRKDFPIDLSRSLHGYARLGNPKCDNPVTERTMRENGLPDRCYVETRQPDGTPIAGLFIVDTTDTSDSNNGHNDFLRSRSGCADFAHVVTRNGDADAGWPGRVSLTPPYAWTLDPDADTSACRMPQADPAP